MMQEVAGSVVATLALSALRACAGGVSPVLLGLLLAAGRNSAAVKNEGVEWSEVSYGGVPNCCNLRAHEA